MLLDDEQWSLMATKTNPIPVELLVSGQHLIIKNNLKNEKVMGGIG